MAGAAWLGRRRFLAQDRCVQRGSVIVRSIWAACLLVAGANHARILLQHGLFWDYNGVGWASAAYWTSLTVLDPLAAALLFVRSKADAELDDQSRKPGTASASTGPSNAMKSVHGCRPRQVARCGALAGP